MGTFGRKCRYSCHCESGACDVASGTCTGDCSIGWSGPSCQRGKLYPWSEQSYLLEKKQRDLLL